MKVAQPQASSSTAGKVDSPSVQLPRVRRLETVKAPHDDLASLFGPVFEINATGICVQIGCSSPYVSRQYRLCDEHLPEFMGVDSADPSALTASPSVATTSSAVTPTQASSSSASRGASSRKDRPRDQSDAALPEPNPKRVKTLKKCDICGYTTDDAHTLGVHKKIHAPESFLMCPEPDCVVGYKLPNQLAAHATWHEDPAPSRSCNECQVTFSRVTRLTTHCTNFHSATSTHAYKVWFGDA
ncbi:hypothetical protein DMC30DRAFT_146709 [Rhodotorula diobovata]|uniref:C2H2-type domain-containing protein n=1 Tax=Rhodotorula diobovata TaxID=5288 RepID=A0A5C5FLK9_9BASI|nr:hypothetical protein DMC30DRAFT_146709 [Rhodotorula diobovata]